MWTSTKMLGNLSSVETCLNIIRVLQHIGMRNGQYTIFAGRAYCGPS